MTSHGGLWQFSDTLGWSSDVRCPGVEWKSLAGGIQHEADRSAFMRTRAYVCPTNPVPHGHNFANRSKNRFSAQAAVQLVGRVESFAIAIAFNDEIDGYRFAPPMLRAMSPSGMCDMEVEQYSLPEGFSPERSLWYAGIFADFKTCMERVFDGDRQQ
jgi:hypothetical protein